MFVFVFVFDQGPLTLPPVRPTWGNAALLHWVYGKTPGLPKHPILLLAREIGGKIWQPGMS
jgi:hypothetical protein